MRDWLWALNEAGRAAPLSFAGYGDAAGRPELRAVVAAYLRRVRGRRGRADTIVICNGFTQGLAARSRPRLRRAGAPAARAGGSRPPRRGCRSPNSAGLNAVPIPVDDDGVRVDERCRVRVPVRWC